VEEPPSGSCPEQLDALWERNGFGAVSLAHRAELLRTAVDRQLSRGDFLSPHPAQEERPPGSGLPGLVVDGVIRIFVATPQRQVTLQYVSEGELFGVPWIEHAGGVATLSAQAQALAPARVLLFSPATLVALSNGDIDMANALISALRGALRASVSLLASNVLWSLRQRVAHHLLDLARPRGDSLVVPMTVQDLADATGTVREVVTRLLKDMRGQGLIDRIDGDLAVLDAHGLHLLAQGRDPRPTGCSSTRSTPAPHRLLAR
jgi:CRP/FNR family transcriptional regulator